jgi:glutathione synthase/RimK-type ligase-like ATP-grasp enzyme
MNVALVTCARLPEPDPDAALLGQALDAAGLRWQARAWDAPDIDWSAAPMTLVRSPWNYPQHLSAFLAWAQATARVTALWNPLPVIRWNAHKSYLLDLRERGVAITPTALVPRGSELTLAEICAQRRWSDVVIKPAISAASFRTRRFSWSMHAAGEAHLRALAAERDVLVQEYLPSVEDHGERALVWIDGALTHAIRKTPRFEDDAEAVSPAAVNISGAEAELAERAMAAATDIMDSPLLYGRVDVAPGPQGQPVLMELELIEPSLYFQQSQGALERFVAGIGRRLGESA